MHSTLPSSLKSHLPELPALAALESLPSDLRQVLGWRQLFGLSLNATHDTSAELRPLLTVVTFCYASNLLGSEDIADASYTDPDLIQVAGEVETSVSALRQFRRHHRMLLESSLCHVFAGALMITSGQEPSAEAYAAAEEFAKRRVDLAVVFDVAMSG